MAVRCSRRDRGSDAHPLRPGAWQHGLTMTQPWASQLPSAIPLRDFLVAAAAPESDAAVCVFAPDESVEPNDRRGYAALVIAYSRFEEPVAILDDGCCALLIREGGVSAATAAARRILAQAGRMGLASRLRVGVAAVLDTPDDALLSARGGAAASTPGEVSGAA
jgi:hypothetical protein